MKTVLETLKKSIAAGLMISVGATIYLSLENKVIGALMFSIGLFVICAFEMFLFTGKIGYVIDNKNKPNCLLIWLGNLMGCVIGMTLIRIAKPQLCAVADEMVSAKLSQNIFAIMILSFFCGILMYIAVENYRTNKHGSGKIVGIFLCVSTFILCGFEHSIADMCYSVLAISDAREALNCLLFILLVSVFNGVGAVTIRALTKVKE